VDEAGADARFACETLGRPLSETAGEEEFEREGLGRIVLGSGSAPATAALRVDVDDLVDFRLSTFSEQRENLVGIEDVAGLEVLHADDGLMQPESDYLRMQ
jgi:hypothetical protein